MTTLNPLIELDLPHGTRITVSEIIQMDDDGLMQLDYTFVRRGRLSRHQTRKMLSRFMVNVMLCGALRAIRERQQGRAEDVVVSLVSSEKGGNSTTARQIQAASVLLTKKWLGAADRAARWNARHVRVRAMREDETGVDPV